MENVAAITLCEQKASIRVAGNMFNGQLLHFVAEGVAKIYYLTISLFPLTAQQSQIMKSAPAR